MNEDHLKSFKLDLESAVRGDVSFEEATLGIYSTDASIYQIKPVVVFLPKDEHDVKAAIKIAGKYKVHILPRGGGTSLGGQAIGQAMIIDFTKYMNQILELNVEEKWICVQPGIVLDELNASLAKHNLHFAPDPATSSRATIGGMIGNNSSGTKSIFYGITKDHVLETKVVLSEGEILDLKEISHEDWENYYQSKNDNGRESEIYKQFKQIIEKNRDEISLHYPKLMRRVQGYNLDSFVDSEGWNLSKLIVGSEGTLATVLEAKLNLEPLPKHKILCAVHFSDLLEAIRTVSSILRHQPSAVEIMDNEIVTRARENLSIAPLCSFIEGNPQAILIVEFFGDTVEQAEQKANALATDLQKKKFGYTWPILVETKEQAKVWAVRKNGLGLMLGIKGDRKPVAFIEDACVPMANLPEYVDQILKFCKERDVPVAMYAHASVGLIHVRPVLNLKDQMDINHLKAISEYSYQLVKNYGGSISGEHGDGRVRSPYLQRFFGDHIYQAFREVKKLFDPLGIMNPGVIVDPNPIDQDLRYGTKYKSQPIKTEYHYRDMGGFAQAVEMCTGVGACRQNLAGTMCPSFRVTRDEEHSTRGRANILRLAMTDQLDQQGLTSEKLHQVMDLCLSCKSCKAECPSNVDVARLKSEFLQKYYDEHGISLRDKLISNSTLAASKMVGWKAPFINFMQQTFVSRLLFEWIAKVDKQRKLPSYAKQTFGKWFENRQNTNGPSNGKIVLFDDTYMNFHEPNVGISAVELLESCGYEVVLAKAGCCQRPKISHGFLREAKKEGEKTLRNLDKFIQKGMSIVVCEPGCASALTDDLPDLLDDEDLGLRIKNNVKMIDQFLAEEIRANHVDCQFISQFEEIMIHGHCHQKSLVGTSAMKEILERIPGISVQEIDSGCCGMAGSFGYEKEHYDLSMKIGEQRLFPTIRELKAGTAVIACGFSCRHQIKDGTGVKAMHWVETLRGR